MADEDKQTIARAKLAELGFYWVGGKWVADGGASGGGTGC